MPFLSRNVNIQRFWTNNFGLRARRIFLLAFLRLEKRPHFNYACLYQKPCHKTDMAMEVTKSKKQLTVGISEALPQSAVQLSRHMKKQRLTTSLLSNSELQVMVWYEKTFTFTIYSKKYHHHTKIYSFSISIMHHHFHHHILYWTVHTLGLIWSNYGSFWWL